MATTEDPPSEQEALAAEHQVGMCDGPETCEIEITPKMVDAGSAVLCRMETSLADEEFWAEEIYRAMVLAQREVD